MFRNIKIRFRITFLVFVATFCTVVAIGAVVLRPGFTPNVKALAYAGVVVCSFAGAVAMVYARSLTKPLSSLDKTLRLVSRGELPEQSYQRFHGELGHMQSRLDDLVRVLKENASFAQKVGEGKFDTPFQPAGENDKLGHALIDMRDNLVANESKENERNWIMLRLAEAGEILRIHDTIDKLGEDIIRFVIGKTNAIQGAFYVVNEESNVIEMVNSFAYNRKKYLQSKFAVAEGLVGQAVAERDIILRTEIPDDYMTITSGILGDKKPSCLLIMPLIANEKAYGAIEIAGFVKFDSTRVKFIKELSVMLARTIFNITVNERTRQLLAESQALARDLREKQEALTESNTRLAEQMEEVNRTRDRMQLLLENASEVITICEANGTIRYVSPSVETIFGYQAAEMQGSANIENIQADSRSVYFDLFKAKPSEEATAQYQYRTKKGDYIWVETTATNLMSNPAIHGFILNSRDITERRRAEQEQRMRSKMQALSENSTDLITRLEGDVISYINPMIESYTGKDASAFLNQQIKNADLDNNILEHWLKIVEQVNQTNEKVLTEMDFPSQLGKRVMQVNAIPEFDEAEKLESVLVVSHDITDRKKIELDIQEKNKKINDSINYARRIQNAILPDNSIIGKVLPDSFILYKPRDVVSGDFPWFVSSGDNIFIAAVDCTGHGVPGALLSLIGYFLLNDIVRSRGVTDPGKILDLLDEGVTQTLRQDRGDAATKDGMDIALCRINLKKKEVEYAGAHRPLLVMKSKVMEEIKGDRFPIGGGIAKNQVSFTTTRIQLKPGDSIYFSSDGFPDQFGGDDGRKLGSKKTRELVESLADLKGLDAMSAFDEAWEAWRGNHKQTDDVLLIGIRF
jgi:PAS domain S-box-containing protein